jgi:hypothetical protein
MLAMLLAVLPLAFARSAEASRVATMQILNAAVYYKEYYGSVGRRFNGFEEIVGSIPTGSHEPSVSPVRK